MAIALLPGPAAFADPPDAASAVGEGGGQPAVVRLDGVDPRPKTITLITGDKVTLTSAGTGPGAFSVKVDPAPRPDGRIPVFHGTGDEDAFFLFPDDAQPAVQSGMVDRDLFNLTYLAEQGYTDGDIDSLPLIAQYPQGQAARSLSASAAALPASEPGFELSSIHAAGLKVSKGEASGFWTAIRPTTAGPANRTKGLSTGIGKLWLDRKVTVSLDESVGMIGAPEAWGLGLDGTGVTVAVLDSGYDKNHPDLAGKVVAAKGFDLFGNTTTHDGNGHGTHVASTVAGSGAASGGRYEGVAPGTDLMIGKVLNDAGQGFMSSVIEGMEWAANNGADIISMSLGGTPTADDPSAQAVDELTESTGALFVIAAGNDGPREVKIGAPGIADAALTVAAVDKSDQLANFSSRGPRADGALKPDIAAPGVAITAARSAGTDMGGGGVPVDDHYITANGTSMATPHVAGAAAILVQQHPDWTPAQLKAALMSTSADVGHSVYERGAGRVDIARAVEQTVVATTASADFRIVPHESGPIDRQITYRNTGDTDLTLTLTTNLRRIGGDAAPDGTLTVDRQLTVPAGGAATATVTLNSTGLAHGRYTGAVVATNQTAGVRLSTPVGFRHQPPLHRLTVKVLDRDGRPTMTEYVEAIDVTNELGNFGVLGRWVSTGVFETLVPEGAIHVATATEWIDEARRQNIGYLLAPEVKVTGDTEVTLDARDLQRFTFRTSRPAEVPASGDTITMGWQRTLAGGLRVGAYSNAMYSYQFWATPTPPVKVGELQVYAMMSLAAPEVTLRVKGAAKLRLHPMMWPHEGTTFNGGFTGELFTGTQTLRLVDAGLGRPEDFAGRDLTGTLALLEVNSTCDVGIDRLHHLRDAGAAGVLAWPSHEVNGPTCAGGPHVPMGVRLTPEDSDRDIGIPYVSIAPGEARALRERLSRHRVEIEVTGTPESSYLYEATPIEIGRVSDSLTYDLTDRRVATVDTEYHATGPTAFTTQWRAFTANMFLIHSVYPPPVIGPATRTRYVGPLSDQVIHQSLVYDTHNTDRSFFKADLHDRPVRTREVWNGAAGVPGSLTYPAAIARMEPESPQLQHPNFGMCAMCREGDEFYPVFHRTFGGREYQIQYFAPGLTHLYQGDREIPLKTDRDVPSFTLPAEPGKYRLTLHDPALRTRTEWTFRSQGSVTKEEPPNGLYCPSALTSGDPACRPEPLVYASYDLGDQLGLDNTVKAPGAHRFTVHAYHAPSRAKSPEIAGLRLWYSQDDGKTWRSAQVKKNRNGEFEVRAVYAPKGGTGAVSLKLKAWDKAGNTLTQTTTRAFELRHHNPRLHRGVE
ncbi:S8 family serine peptidase [Plantactinospora sp. B6F1]|uniref:S8 family serine peptidase n=1 Tax=Plantactinospora sp. B6F1 TaxID=3158971 RepID=UPI0032D94B45